MKKLYCRLISFILAFCIVCAYPLTAFGITSNVSGSEHGYCLIEIANNEIGYQETGTNITKYGAWYGSQVEWCAVFVSWCANQANIPTSIIPKTASPYYFANFYNQQGRYFKPTSQGGTIEPRPGDLYFYYSTHSNPGHVGIIVSVDSSNIYVIDGNWSNKVSSRAISKNDSNFVGFARPAYTTSHNALSFEHTSSGHWAVCDTCGMNNSNNIMSHTYSKGKYAYSAIEHWPKCDYCGYDQSSSANAHVYDDTYGYSGTHHWLVCEICGRPSTNRTVHMFEMEAQTGIQTCILCNYKVNTSLDSVVENPEMQID